MSLSLVKQGDGHLVGFEIKRAFANFLKRGVNTFRIPNDSLYAFVGEMNRTNTWSGRMLHCVIHHVQCIQQKKRKTFGNIQWKLKILFAKIARCWNSQNLMKTFGNEEMPRGALFAGAEVMWKYICERAAIHEHDRRRASSSIFLLMLFFARVETQEQAWGNLVQLSSPRLFSFLNY